MYKRKPSTGYRIAEKQEQVWKMEALREGKVEKRRSRHYKKTDPQLAAELEWDARNAMLWYNKRDKRVKRLEKMAKKAKGRGR